MAVGVDGADTAGQHVTNHGRLLGCSGSALAGLGVIARRRRRA